MAITARALMLELLVAAAPRPVPVRDLVAAGRLFDLAENALRVTLARLGAEGLVFSAARGAYALAPAAEPLAREVAAWRGAEGRLRRWDGRYVVVHTGALGRADRAALRRRERALSLLGFAELARGLAVRPDNLRGGVAGVRARLLSLGLPPGALVAALGELDPGDAARAAALWDGAALVAGYRRTRLEIERWLARAPRLSLEVAARESFLLGRRAIRELVYDPWLPPPLVDPEERRAFVEATLSLDAEGHRTWRRFFGRAGEGLRAGVGTRVAQAVAS